MTHGCKRMCFREDLDRKRTRLACKMDILDFFRGCAASQEGSKSRVSGWASLFLAPRFAKAPLSA